MINKIFFCTVVAYSYILAHVNSQRIIESKCYEYSQIPQNSSNPMAHIAIWSTMFPDDNPDVIFELRHYVILISDKVLLGNYIEREFDVEFDSILQDPLNNKVYFTPTDVHDVTEILAESIIDERRRSSNVIHKIMLIKINRITIDSNHRPACLWARTDFLTDTVNFVQNRHAVYNNGNERSHVLFDMQKETTTTRVSYESRDCRSVSITRSFCFKLNLDDNDNWFTHPPLLQSYKPFPFLPSNYYIYGIGTPPSSNERYYYNLPISSRYDWIEAVVWGTDSTSCGTANININPMILHSQPTLPEEFPWHAALFHMLGIGRREYKCGGTLVNQNTVVTAAHCVSSPAGTLSHEILIVNLGKHDIDLHSLDSRETRVSRILVHTSYSRYNYANDIALLKLQTIISYSKYIQPICVTKNLRLFENTIGVLPGWGLNEFNQPQAILSKGSFPIRPQSECRGYGHITNSLAGLVNENNFCAGYENGTNVCRGDSGGGLVFKVNDKWYLRGVASVGTSISESGQCDPLGLSIFTDVTQFYDWIVDN